MALCCSHNPHKSMIAYHLQEIGKGLEFYASNYEKILLMGDFNSEMLEGSINSFCNLYNLRCLVSSRASILYWTLSLKLWESFPKNRDFRN